MLDFSIITVVKNDFDGIKNSLLSVKKQNFDSYEHIVIDGYSNDGTYEFIKKFNNKKIQLERFRDKNLYESINYALHKCSAKYVLFLHSSDIFFSKDTLSLIKDKIKCEPDILFGGCIYYDKKKKIKRIWKINIKHSNLKKEDFFSFPHTGIIYKKENLKKIGEYNLQYSISSDTDYIIRLLSNINLNLNSNAINLNQFICFMETGGASNKVNNIISKIKQDTKILIEHFGLRIINLYPMKIFSKFKNFTRKNKLFYELKLKLLIENLED